jgi:hypothetical protein
MFSLITPVGLDTERRSSVIFSDITPLVKEDKLKTKKLF